MVRGERGEKIVGELRRFLGFLSPRWLSSRRIYLKPRRGPSVCWSQAGAKNMKLSGINEVGREGREGRQESYVSL